MGDAKIPDLNQVILSGRLTRDPDLRYTSSNVAVCKFSIANSRKYKDRDGNRKEETVFVDVTVWKAAAEYIGEHVKKGMPVIVEGKLHQEEWDDRKTGEKRRKLSVTAFRVQTLEWGDHGSQGGTQADPRQSQETRQAAQQEIPEDDIPF